MKIAFTLCSNNYLAQAKTLGDSIKRTNPDYLFFIGLNDALSDEIDYEKEIGHSIILSNEIGIPDFDDLWKRYSIIEFNTCVKPFYFQYFITKYSAIEYIFYFDPDIYIFNNLRHLEHEFEEETKILITPHILSPIAIDGKTPGENIFLNFGIFNLGFLGLKSPGLSHDFLEWWKERTYRLGFNQPGNGLFVDQLWFNLVPLFFKSVKISKHPGLNMAPWNLHERVLKESKNKLFVNKIFPLIFYHFSNYKYSDPEIIANHYSRHHFNNRPDLQKMYQAYQNKLINNGVGKLSNITCRYMELRQEYLMEEILRITRSSKRNLLKYYLKKILPPVIIRIIKAIKN